ncbi:TPA: hypothetical protein L4V00_000210 [Pseudomonas aeruginosa]|nr:hypothetical protein [Pseudomonas aeruginosa]HBO4702836.1 hypothetical protein [Pseudomonas aeruginosa]
MKKKNSTDLNFSLEKITSEVIQKLLNTPTPESIKLKLSSKHRLYHIGALAYPERNSFTDISNTSNIDESRRPAILSLIDSYYTSYSSGDTRIRTIKAKVERSFKYFDWADKNKYKGIFSDIEAAKTSIQGYIQHLDLLIYQGKIGENYAILLQNTAIDALALVHHISRPRLTRGISLLSGGLKKPTELADESSTSINLALSHILFNQITDWLLGQHSQYPFPLELPNEVTWIFPGRAWIMPDFKQRIRETLKQPSWAWGYDSGRVNSAEFISEKYKLPINDGQKTRDRSLQILESANKDKRHPSRLQLANIAVRAFIFLFLNNTGMNTQSLIDQTWLDRNSPDGLITVNGVRFVTYKARAEKYVSFRIQKTFKPSFDKYLELRKYILGGKHHDHLFVLLNREKQPTLITEACQCIYFNQLRNLIDPNVQNITSRQIRGRKESEAQDKIISKPEDLIQASKNTAHIHYSTGDEKKQSIELTNYYKSISQIILFSSTDHNNHTTSLSNGNCRKHGNPVPNQIPLSVNPDCQSPDGCFGCENFFIHADRTDIHKLLSMQSVFRDVSRAMFNKATFQAEFQPTLDHIERIISRIKSYSKDHFDLVSSVEGQIAKGNLTDYWSRKQENLVDLGLLND